MCRDYTNFDISLSIKYGLHFKITIFVKWLYSAVWDFWFWFNVLQLIIVSSYTWFVQKLSGLTTVHEVGKAYGILTLIVFNIVPLRSCTLRPTFLPLLETFCELLFRDV